MEKNALAVMVRVPAPGKVKTRLTPGLSELEACQLYEAFLKDLFSRLCALASTDIFIYYAIPDGREAVTDGCETIPDGREAVTDGQETTSDGSEMAVDKLRVLSDLIPEPFALTPQKDGDLGGRMQGAFEELFSRGYTRVALIGSDSPDIPLTHIRRTFMVLTGPCSEEEPRRLVLGPALDGGYYLIAMNASLASSSASLFTGIEWGSASVLQETLGKAQDAGMQVAMLAEWHDVDTCEDLAYIEGSDCLPATALVLQGLTRRQP